MPRDEDEARRRARLGESEALGGSALARAARAAADHLGARDAPDTDAAELWGRRVGRSLGAATTVLLLLVLLWSLAG